MIPYAQGACEAPHGASWGGAASVYWRWPEKVSEEAGCITADVLHGRAVDYLDVDGVVAAEGEGGKSGQMADVQAWREDTPLGS